MNVGRLALTGYVAGGLISTTSLSTVIAFSQAIRLVAFENTAGPIQRSKWYFFFCDAFVSVIERRARALLNIALRYKLFETRYAGGRDRQDT